MIVANPQMTVKARKKCNSACFVQIICSFFAIACSVLLGYGIFLMADAHNNVSAPSQNLFNQIIANWTNYFLPDFRSWQISIQYLNKTSSIIKEFSLLQITQQKNYAIPGSFQINPYEQLSFNDKDISNLVKVINGEKQYGNQSDGAFNITFASILKIFDNLEQESSKFELPQIPGLFGHVSFDMNIKQCTQQYSGKWSPDINKCLYFTQLTKICLVILQDSTKTQNYSLIKDYNNFKCDGINEGFLLFQPFYWRDTSVDPQLIDIQSDIQISVQSSQDPYVQYISNNFGISKDLPITLQAVMGFILVCVAILLCLIPFRLLFFSKYLKRYTDQNQLRPHRYSNIV